MRGLFLGSYGGVKRNDPTRLIPTNPRPKFAERCDTGNAGADGYTVISRADPNYAGRLPPVPGTDGQTHQGPDNSFEQ